MIAAVVLAAGASRRLGRPKQLVTFEGEALLQRAVRVAREAGCAPVVVVLGARAEEIEAAVPLEGVRVVRNPEWDEGMASSIRVGVRALGEPEGVLVMACDMPLVSAEHVKALMAARGVAASGYADGRRGVPAVFPKDVFGELMSLRGDVGAREMLRGTGVFVLGLEEGAEVDVDTVEDVEGLVG